MEVLTTRISRIIQSVLKYSLTTQCCLKTVLFKGDSLNKQVGTHSSLLFFSYCVYYLDQPGSDVKEVEQTEAVAAPMPSLGLGLTPSSMGITSSQLSSLAQIASLTGANPQTLLSRPDIRLDLADHKYGCTALHNACDGEDRPSIIPLIAQHRSCTSADINKRSKFGATPLMAAVEESKLECVKELGKLEGTNFRTKNNRGETLIDVARRSCTGGYYEWYDDKIIKYLIEKQKKETLKEKAAYHVARHLNNVEDVEKLGIPRTLYSLVRKFID